MANPIHPTAIIDPAALLDEGVEVGPYSIIGAGVHVGANTIIGPHVIIENGSVIGADCRIASGAVLGGPPQDLAYKGEPTGIRIGNGTQIRECVTINRATGEGEETVIGENCFFMAYSHAAHNCRIGNNVILANAVQLGGYVQLGDYSFIGGGSVMHQFVRVGRMAFLGGASATRQDIPPFAMTDGRPASIQGINSIGLRRRGLTSGERQLLKKAFFYLWFSGLNQSQAIEAIRANLEMNPYIQELLDFVLSSKRGISHKAGTESASGNEEAEKEPLSIA